MFTSHHLSAAPWPIGTLQRISELFMAGKEFVLAFYASSMLEHEAPIEEFPTQKKKGKNK